MFLIGCSWTSCVVVNDVVTVVVQIDNFITVVILMKIVVDNVVLASVVFGVVDGLAHHVVGLVLLVSVDVLICLVDFAAVFVMVIAVNDVVAVFFLSFFLLSILLLWECL